jgi:hypothetical protein
MSGTRKKGSADYIERTLGIFIYFSWNTRKPSIGLVRPG